MREMLKTIPIILGLLAACGAPGTHSSFAVEDGTDLHVVVNRIPTAEQLALVAALAEQVVEAEQLSYDLQETSELAEQLRYRVHLESLIEVLERREQQLQLSGALRSDISRISLRADVAIPLEELKLTLSGTRRQEPGLPSPY